jgi:hypothetical protein
MMRINKAKAEMTQVERAMVEVLWAAGMRMAR